MYQHAHLPSAEGFLPPQIVGTFYMQGYKVEEKTAIVPLKTSFVDFEKSRHIVVITKNYFFLSLPNYPYSSSGSQKSLPHWPNICLVSTILYTQGAH
jgi:hypothetical protein